jgi:hypothetical protein
MYSLLNTSETLGCAYPILPENHPKSSLGYSTNNQYKDFPPIMSDSRAVFAAWQPESIVNNDLLKESGIKTNWHYRKYMTDNANQIMRYNMTESCNDIGYYKRLYNPDPESVKTSTGTPYLYTSFLDKTPVLGVQQNDLKQMYLTREQLESRKVSPAVNQEDILKRQTLAK